MVRVLKVLLFHFNLLHFRCSLTVSTHSLVYTYVHAYVAALVITYYMSHILVDVLTLLHVTCISTCMYLLQDICRY